MKPFRRTLVVKLLGRQPSYGFMVKKLRQIWGRKGNIDVFDLENDFYLVNFQHNEDYMEALTGGPWVILDAYLNVARWRPEFCPKNSKIESVVAWVRFPDLPAPLFDKKFLLNLGNAIGKAIRLDIHTAQRARGKFARMCVELDLNKPLIPEFNVEGKVLSVVYESLGMLCTKCGWVGHQKEGCAVFHKKKSEVGMDVEVPEERQTNENKNGEGSELWKVVQRTRRPRWGPAVLKAPQQGSRFAILNRDLGEEGKETNGEEDHASAEPKGNGMTVQKEVPHRVARRGVEAGNSKNVPRGEELTKNIIRGATIKEGKKEKMVYATRKSGIAKGEDERNQSRDALKGLNSIVRVPKSDPDAYRGNGIKLMGKENLNPGEHLSVPPGDVGMDVETIERNGLKEDPIEMCSMSKVERCATPNLADARGAASKGFAAVLRDMKKRYKVDVVVILEPRISGTTASRVIKNWGFQYSVRREAEGFSGGIWILWNREELLVNVIEMDDQYIHCRMCIDSKSMLFTAVYANPNEQRRHRVWDRLFNLSLEISEPWLLAGDYNDIKTPLEQKGGGRVNEARCNHFNSWLQSCRLIDLETSGPFYTWKGPKWEGLERVYKRLDRCLCNVAWQTLFQEAEIRIIPRVCSDHHPILVKLGMECKRNKVKPFRFEAAWQTHESFVETVKGSWREEDETHVNLLGLQKTLAKWNKEVFGHIELRKQRILNRAGGLLLNVG
ncbi:hypothetical protein K1719_037589 [Acacia pycnantha]|nr:hypothetical protein K1719_037589 [Acacia pycnantha]